MIIARPSKKGAIIKWYLLVQPKRGASGKSPKQEKLKSECFNTSFQY